jgi:tetratricopeptide (TPR) repeat protein
VLRRLTLLGSFWLLPIFIGVAALGLRGNRLAAAWWNNQGARALNESQIPPGRADADRYAAAVNAGLALEQALRFDPTFGKAYTNLGNVYSTLGDLPAATQALSDAARYTPRDWRARFFLGQALAAQGREAEARVAWRDADAALYFAHRYDDLTGSDPTEALLQAERARAADTDRIDGHLVLAHALAAQQAYTDALAVYADAIARAPKDLKALAQAYADMGTLLHRHLGRPAEGAAALEQAVALQPKDEGPRLTLAAISSERGACYEAEAWLAPLFDQPSSPAVHAQASALVGACLLTQDRAQTAIPYFERAAADEPTSVPNWLLLAEAHRAAGQIQAAIDVFTHVLSLSPGHADAAEALDELQRATP